MYILQSLRKLVQENSIIIEIIDPTLMTWYKLDTITSKEYISLNSIRQSGCNICFASMTGGDRRRWGSCITSSFDRQPLCSVSIS